MNQTLIVYSKICLDCHDKRWKPLRSKLMAEGYVIKFRRTALNPIWHALAVKATGLEDYEPFILYPDGKIKTVKELENEKEEKVSQMRRNTTTKLPRTGSVARKKNKAKKEA